MTAPKFTHNFEFLTNNLNFLSFAETEHFIRQTLSTKILHKIKQFYMKHLHGMDFKYPFSQEFLNTKRISEMKMFITYLLFPFLKDKVFLDSYMALDVLMLAM